MGVSSFCTDKGEMSNPSTNRGSTAAVDETPTAMRYKRRLEAREQAESAQQAAANRATAKASKRRKKKAKRRRREPKASRPWLSPDHTRKSTRSRNSDNALPPVVEPRDGSSPVALSQATGSSHHPESGPQPNSIPSNHGEAMGASRPDVSFLLEGFAQRLNSVAPRDSTQPTSSQYDAPDQVASEQLFATSSGTKTKDHRTKTVRRRPREGIASRAPLPLDPIAMLLSRNSNEMLPAMVDHDGGPLPAIPGRIAGTVRHPEYEQPINFGQTNVEARNPMHPSSRSNAYEGTNRHEQNPQFFSGVPAAASSYPTPSASVMECAAPRSSGDTPNQAQETPTDLSAVGEWRVVHEAGYSPIMSLSYVPPMKKDIGVFPSRWAAVRYGQQLVGSVGGCTWSQVRDSGNLEIVAASSNRWEICWRPPDSEYSRVTATLLAPGAGRWVVDVERGHIPDGVHSYVAPTKNTLGPFQSREIAVARAKKEVGAKLGLSWFDVVRGNDFENREDSANRWEGYWEPQNSEYSHVIVKLLVPAVSDDLGNGTSASVGNSWNDDQQPTSSSAGLKQAALMSSGPELPLAF